MSSSPRSNEAREGRRRRLAERGTDRMALITGQISSLPPPPPPPPAPSSVPLSPKLSFRRNLPPRHVRPESLPVELAQEIQPDLRATQSFTLPAIDELKPDGSRFSSRLRHQSGFKFKKKMDFDIINEEESRSQDPDNANAEAQHQVPPMNDDAEISRSVADADSDAEDKYNASSSSNRLKHQSGFKFTKRKNFEIRSEVKPLTQDSGTNNTKAEAKEQVAVKPSSATSRTKDMASDGRKKLPKPVNFNPALLSSRDINSSIIASETLRAFCALIIAILVVLCYMMSEKIAAVRPLYIVLLNDVTIVLVRAYVEKLKASEEGEGGGERVAANNEQGHDWNGVKLLERGLVAYQALRGVFIDFSVYSVIVISCVSLMK